MTWTVIARQDGARTVGARSIKLLLGVLFVAVVLRAYVYPVMSEPPITTTRFTGYVIDWLATMVPLIGVVLGYDAIVSDRESGAIYLSLSLPHSREDLVLGRFVGRAGVLTGALVLALTVAGALVVYPFGDLVLVRYLAFVLLTVAFGALWVGLGVAVSASVATRQRALVLAFGLVVLFAFSWGVLEGALTTGLTVAGVVDGSLPHPIAFGFDLAPGRLYERLTIGFIYPSASIEGPWYRSAWVALVAFVGWAVGPLWLAIRRFEGRDLS